MKRFATLLLLLFAFGAQPASAAHAWQAPGLTPVAQKSGMSLDRAVAKVRKQTGGRILSAETVRDEEGRKVHRIKVLTPEHKVRVFTFAAE